MKDGIESVATITIVNKEWKTNTLRRVSGIKGPTMVSFMNQQLSNSKELKAYMDSRIKNKHPFEKYEPMTDVELLFEDLLAFDYLNGVLILVNNRSDTVFRRPKPIYDSFVCYMLNLEKCMYFIVHICMVCMII